MEGVGGRGEDLGAAIKFWSGYPIELSPYENARKDQSESRLPANGPFIGNQVTDGKLSKRSEC